MTCEEFVDSFKKRHSSNLEVQEPNFNWWSLLDAIVFIDCTWQQSFKMLQVILNLLQRVSAVCYHVL